MPAKSIMGKSIRLDVAKAMLYRNMSKP